MVSRVKCESNRDIKGIWWGHRGTITNHIAIWVCLWLGYTSLEIGGAPFSIFRQTQLFCTRIVKWSPIKTYNGKTREAGFTHHGFQQKCFAAYDLQHLQHRSMVPPGSHTHRAAPSSPLHRKNPAVASIPAAHHPPRHGGMKWDGGYE